MTQHLAQPDEPLKALLLARLRSDRSTLWQKAGLVGEQPLPEREQRTPMTPTGTNLLGLVKHVALVEAQYFGDCLGNPFPDPPAYYDAEDPTFEPDDDLWAFADESPADVLALARRAAAHAEAGVAAHALGDVGVVPWWGSAGREATLAELMVHMLDELARHLGHADILRELLDGQAGLREGVSNLPAHRTPDEWARRRARLQALADASRGADATAAPSGPKLER